MIKQAKVATFLPGRTVGTCNFLTLFEIVASRARNKTNEEDDVNELMSSEIYHL
jgi:hypothetical protein